MPRPVKCRKVCHFPNVLEFLPADDTEKKMPIVLTVDEYETIRLLDKKGYSQEQCAVSMQIARIHFSPFEICIFPSWNDSLSNIKDGK